ncbi:MAG: Signal peptide peptidase SppA [Phycisphaerales bacterium]|nr:Signal peptide peptidase SppA [Phycisphaerales bacterium]
MKALIAASLLILGWLVLAEEKAPAAAPSPDSAAATEKSPADADKADKSEDKLPTPGELIKKLKAAEEKQAKKTKIAYFDFSGRPITEKPAGFSLFGDDGSMTLRSVLHRLRQVRDDKDIKGVLITMGDGGFNFSQAQELRDALLQLKRAGKATYVYADGYDTDSYTVASGAQHVCILEGGEIMLPGVGLETTFYKGLFDKVGVKADYVQIGEFKGADEEYTRTDASPELRGELTKLTEGLYAQIVDGIARNRNLPKEVITAVIDESIITGKNAKEKGLVDELTDQDSLRALITKDIGNDIDLVADYGRAPREADLSNPMALFSLLMKKPQPESDKPEVALIYAEGVIVDGEGGDSLFSEDGVASQAMRKALRIASRDENIKAIVIRIDSPGGSALASEVMWQAVRHAAEKKPVIVSIGSMAASGGYYLACAGDKIYADSSAIVGSIGVVGGKFVYKGLYDWAGVKTESFSKGKNAGLFSSNEPWSDRQRTMVESWMHQTYVQFTERVMKTRAGKIKDIDQVARGRIFLAKQAKDLGMVDEIGGIDDALAYAATKVGLDEGKYDVRVVPQPKSLGDLLTGGGPDAAFAFQPKIELKADAILGAVSPSLRKAMARELRMLQILQERPVVLMSPYNVTIK